MLQKKNALVLASLVSILGVACAPRPAATASTSASTTHTTNAQVPAASAEPAADPELSRLLAEGSADPVLSAVTIAVIHHDDARTLALTDPIVTTADPAEHHNPWLDYDRAIALAHLGRTDEAVASYESARKGFESSDVSASGGASSGKGRSLALYGEARALGEAHRCKEAKRAYEQYAMVIRPTSGKDAEMALAYAADCHAAPLR